MPHPSGRISGLARKLSHKFSSQSRGARFCEVSGVGAIAALGFWLTLLGSPRPTEAAVPSSIGIDVAAITVSQRLQVFEETDQRHTGVLDTLRP